jgi:putative serine protease PepD
VLGAYLHDNGGGQDVTLPQATAEAGPRAPDSIAGIAAKVLPGVVYIHVKGADGEGTGTGFVLDGEGHILTNNHVVESVAKSGTISVTFNGGQVGSARIVGRDTGYDLAVIKVSGVKGLHPLPLGDSDAARVGDPVVAIGAPYGLEGTVTSGIISATQRPITAGGETNGSDVSYVDAIQTDAPINPGNSGGPLVDAGGLVIGINSAIRSAESGTDPFGNSSQGGSIGLGFAIPVNQAKRVAEQLINDGKATHPVIGVSINMQYTGDGAQVSPEGEGTGDSVTADGPGAKAGVEPGDVITSIDGKRVHSGEELIVRIRAHRPGDTLLLTLKRNGKQHAVQLTLGSATGS